MQHFHLFRVIDQDNAHATGVAHHKSLQLADHLRSQIPSFLDHKVFSTQLICARKNAPLVQFRAGNLSYRIFDPGFFLYLL